MRDVKLVRLSDDGTHVVLTHEGTGEEFALRIDDRLRGFVTSDRARVGQLPIERPSRLAPKEIQARLRAGESSEDIAAAADVPLERILRYAGPVLAEREYIAEQAQQSALRRQPGESGHGRALGPTVNDRLEMLGANLGQSRWDAWRTPDGKWAIAIIYTGPESNDDRRAVFSFDPLRRVVVPVDEAAQWMAGEYVEAPPPPPVVEGPGPRTPRDARPRLAAVPPPPPDDPVAPPPTYSPNHPAGRAAHSAPDTPAPPVVRPLRSTPPAAEAPSVTEQPPVEDTAAYEDTVDLSRTFGSSSKNGSDPLPELGDAPASSRPVVSRPTPAPEPEPEPEPAPEPPAEPVRAVERTEPAPDALPAGTDFPETAPVVREEPPEPAEPPAPAAQPTARPEPRPEPQPAPAAEREPVPVEPDPDPEPEPETARPTLGRDRKTSPARRKRAAQSRRKGSVPSWDDILFGNSRGKD